MLLPLAAQSTSTTPSGHHPSHCPPPRPPAPAAARPHLRVMVGVVQLQHLGHQDGSGPFRVQLLERLTHQLAPGVHGQATDPREQLPRFDYPGAVAVKEVHELVHLLREREGRGRGGGREGVQGVSFPPAPTVVSRSNTSLGRGREGG